MASAFLICTGANENVENVVDSVLGLVSGLAKERPIISLLGIRKVISRAYGAEASVGDAVRLRDST